MYYLYLYSSVQGLKAYVCIGACDRCNVVHCGPRTGDCERGSIALGAASPRHACVCGIGWLNSSRSGKAAMITMDIGHQTMHRKHIKDSSEISRPYPVEPPSTLKGERYLLHTAAYCIFSSRTWTLCTRWRPGRAPPGGQFWTASGCRPRTAWSTGSKARGGSRYSRLRRGIMSASSRAWWVEGV